MPFRDWSLITGRGEDYKMGGGQFYTYKKGGGGKSISHAEGGGAQKVLG